ncbi:hypothetical protein F5887DRAFT_64389 [Amanita rubescens]|nr:hypothetical protein F5887DRAFT_64389 [Amanita rubescens]
MFYGGAHSWGILALDVQSVQAVPNHIGQNSDRHLRVVERHRHSCAPYYFLGIFGLSFNVDNLAKFWRAWRDHHAILYSTFKQAVCEHGGFCEGRFHVPTVPMRRRNDSFASVTQVASDFQIWSTSGGGPMIVA